MLPIARNSPQVEDTLDVPTQNAVAKVEHLLLRPTAIDDESFGENFGEDALVHSEFGQAEFELVGVAVVGDLFGLWNGFEAAAASCSM